MHRTVRTRTATCFFGLPRGRCLLRGLMSDFDQSSRVADTNGVGAVLRAELVKQVSDVELGGLGAGADLGGDLLVRQPLPDEMEYFPLAGGESLLLPQRVGQFAGHEWGEIGAAGADRAHRGGELLGARVFEQVALGA